jgi:signal transduction histidine kinase
MSTMTNSEPADGRLELLEIGAALLDASAVDAARAERASQIVQRALGRVHTKELPVRLALLLATADWCEGTGAIAKEVRSELQAKLNYGVPLIGGSMARLFGSLGEEHFVEHGLLLVLFCTEELWATVDYLPTPHRLGEELRREKVRELARALERKAGIRLGASANRHLLCITPGIFLGRQGEQIYYDNELHEEILAAFDHHYSLVGGAAANALVPTKGYQFANDECLESGLAIALIETGLAWSNKMMHGLVPRPKPVWTVDKLRDDAHIGYEVERLSKKSAPERVSWLLEAAPLRTQQILLGTLTESLCHVVSSVRRGESHGSCIRLDRKVKLGDRLCVLEADEARIRDAGRIALDEAVRAAGITNAEVSLIWVLSCTGRYNLLTDPTEQLRTNLHDLRATFPRAIFIGGLSAGEFGLSRWRHPESNNFSFWVSCFSHKAAPRTATWQLQRRLLEAGACVAACGSPSQVMKAAVTGACTASAHSGRACTGGQICLVDYTIGLILGHDHAYAYSAPGSGHDWQAVADATLRECPKELSNAFPGNLLNWSVPVRRAEPCEIVDTIPEREDILSLIVETNRAIYVAHYKDPIFHCDLDAAERGHIVTFIAIPLLGSHGKAIATLQLSFADGAIIDRETFGLWVGYGQEVAASLQRAQEVEERTILQELSEFSRPFLQGPVSPEGNPYEWCKDYLRLVKEKLGAYGVHMRALDQTVGGEAYRLVGAIGPLEELRKHTRSLTRPQGGSCHHELLKAGGRITNTLEETRKLNKDVHALEKQEKYGAAFQRELDSIEATAMLPLKHVGEVLGSFVIDSRQRYFFTERRNRLAEAAAALGAAILGGRRDGFRNLKAIADQEKRRAAVEKMEVQLAESMNRAKHEKVMRDAFEDVAHQIKGPLAEAVKRIEGSRGRWESSGFKGDFVNMASLLHRVGATAGLIGLFATLARGEQINVTGKPVAAVDLVRMVEVICESQRPRISARRNIRILVAGDSLLRNAPVELRVDSELVVQALSNVVDNAVKYSYSNTTITVFAERSKKGAFFIGVTNKGIPIRPEEINLVRQRHWRGEKAQLSAGEGNGLGLYIADSIMRAHGGELHVLPTRQGDGVTEVRLVF